MTFSASATIRYNRAPVLLIVKKETWNLCPQALEETIVVELLKVKKPKAIIAVHLYGVHIKLMKYRQLLSVEIPNFRRRWSLKLWEAVIKGKNVALFLVLWRRIIL
jgi:hypothetical protein